MLGITCLKRVQILLSGHPLLQSAPLDLVCRLHLDAHDLWILPLNYLRFGLCHPFLFPIIYPPHTLDVRGDRQLQLLDQLKQKYKF